MWEGCWGFKKKNQKKEKGRSDESNERNAETGGDEEKGRMTGLDNDRESERREESVEEGEKKVEEGQLE